MTGRFCFATPPKGSTDGLSHSFGHLGALSLSTSIVSAQGNSSTPGTPVSRKVGRVFFQDDDSKTLKWSDLTLSDKLQFGTVSVVEGFPSLDKDRQTLVQMEVARG